MPVRWFKCTLFLVLFIMQAAGLTAKDFVLVVDAGHGGHDPGAVGAISREKNINLNVALAFGRLVEKNCPDVKVIYTRKTDVFVPLNKRASIANEAKADLFVSIHTNSIAGNKTIKGASTWTLGLAKTESNLEVAKRENSVIMYEDDYKQVYSGFNPYSSESYIIFELMQDKHMEQSVSFASMLQQQFKNHSGREDRGVHQAGFLVLHASAMPSVLIELGFISNPSEEKYLNSENGVKSLSQAIYNAFINYKNDWQGKNSGALHEINEGNAGNDGSTPQAYGGGKGTDELIFKVQFLTSSKKIDLKDKRFNKLENVECYVENNLYKYTCHSSPDYEHVSKMRKEIAKTYKDAFVVAFKNGKRVDIKQAINEYKTRINK